MADLAQVLQALYQAPLAKFVAERTRLAAKLRADDDKAGAAHLTKARRPSASAWAVNQLYWRARDAYDDLLAAAARLRKGDVDASGAYRDALATLRKGAAAILKGAGHGANDATLRRVTATLSALAAAGGFDPDPAGALAMDRDPPGFDALDVTVRRVAGTGHRSKAPRPHDPRTKRLGDGTDELLRARVRARANEKRREREQRAAERAEVKRQDAERARRKAERRRVEMRLRAAQTEAGRCDRALAGRRRDLRAAEEALDQARAVVEDLSRKLGDLDDVK